MSATLSQVSFMKTSQGKTRECRSQIFLLTVSYCGCLHHNTAPACENRNREDTNRVSHYDGLHSKRNIAIELGLGSELKMHFCL